MGWLHALVLVAVVLVGAAVGLWVFVRLGRALELLSNDLAPDPLDDRDAAAMRDELLSR
jgi:uncharacterized membrane protein